MTILTIHNTYQQPGGEDEVFRQEARLLTAHGHKVISFEASNADLTGRHPVQLLAGTIFNAESYHRVRSLIQQHRPLLMHVHNTFPMLSPAVYYAAADELVPVVQTLHNYRFLCPAGTLFRKGKVCERCVEQGSLLPALTYGCYRDSRSATAAAAAMLMVHRGLKTYENMVSAFIILSEFCRSKFVEAGLPAEKLFLKPNFVHDYVPNFVPGDASMPEDGSKTGDRYCLFAGRLTEEKGIATLLDAWRTFQPAVPLVIAGDGPMGEQVAAAAAECPSIRWRGRLDKPALAQLRRGALAMVVPSIWYEPFGLVAAEAFAAGVPVIASRIGALAEVVDHGRNGLHFNAGDSADLARQVAWLVHHPAALPGLRQAARGDYEQRYSGEENCRLLIDIYEQALQNYGISRRALYNQQSVDSRPGMQHDVIEGTDRDPARILSAVRSRVEESIPLAQPSVVSPSNTQLPVSVPLTMQAQS